MSSRRVTQDRHMEVLRKFQRLLDCKKKHLNDLIRAQEMADSQASFSDATRPVEQPMQNDNNTGNRLKRKHENSEAASTSTQNQKSIGRDGDVFKSSKKSKTFAGETSLGWMGRGATQDAKKTRVHPEHLASTSEMTTINSDFASLGLDQLVRGRDWTRSKSHNNSIGLRQRNLVDFKAVMTSRVVDVQWFDETPLQVFQDDTEDSDEVDYPPEGCLICTCANGIQIHRRMRGGNWIRVIDFTAEHETLKSAGILTSVQEKETVVVFLLSSLFFAGTRSDEQITRRANDQPGTMQMFTEPLKTDQSGTTTYNLTLLKFINGTLRDRNLVYSSFHPLLVCPVRKDGMCISTYSPSPQFLPGATAKSKVDYLGVLIANLAKLERRDMAEVPAKILHLLWVRMSSSVLGFSRDAAYLWHFETGFLLNRFPFEAGCHDFTPCCGNVHNDKGLLVVVGRLTNDKTGHLMFLNPTTGVTTTVPLTDVIPACGIGKLRLLQSGGPLHMAAFVSEDLPEKFQVFSLVGNKVTISRADSIVPGEDGLSRDAIIRFDTRFKSMFLGRGSKICSFNVNAPPGQQSQAS